MVALEHTNVLICRYEETNCGIFIFSNWFRISTESTERAVFTLNHNSEEAKRKVANLINALKHPQTGSFRY